MRFTPSAPLLVPRITGQRRFTSSNQEADTVYLPAHAAVASLATRHCSKSARTSCAIALHRNTLLIRRFGVLVVALDAHLLAMRSASFVNAVDHGFH